MIRLIVVLPVFLLARKAKKIHSSCHSHFQNQGYNFNEKNHEVSDEELKKVIADFLEMGHIENITSMFRQDSRYYAWSGDLLRDERFNVRLGMAVLFEELREIQPQNLALAVPSSCPCLMTTIHSFVAKRFPC